MLYIILKKLLLLSKLKFLFYTYLIYSINRPNDSRYSNALGEVYERTQKLHEAKKCYWRSYCVGDIEGNALAKYAQ
jgi:anaphase-promoting complex subunit 8